MARWPIHDEEEIEAVAAVLRSGKSNYWTGTEGIEFEREWAAACGTNHALTCSSGTTALEMALRAVAVRGSQVVIPARTFVATASAVVTAGGRPVLADIDRDTLCVTWDTIAARLAPDTSAVVVVHYAGLVTPDIQRIAEECRKRGIALIEDAAHAHLATGPDGRRAGSYGDIGCFSMCVGKVMSTGGEGGAVTTGDEELLARMSAWRDHGRFQMTGSRDVADLTTFKYTVERFGSNARITEMQAAIARRQLRKLPAWTARRRDIMWAYDAALKADVWDGGHAGYMYLLPVPDDGTKERLLAAVPSARYGGCANIGREPCWDYMGWTPELCPVADETGRTRVGLPVYPTMNDDDVAAVIQDVLAVLRG